MNPTHPDKSFMQAAITKAKESAAAGDYAIGAIIVCNGQIISSGTNTSKITEDPTGHAEMVAIREAAKILSTRHLRGCVLYTTHEPCPMCASAAVWAMLDGIVWGAPMEAMTNHAQNNSTEHHLWRTILIKATEITEKAPNSLFVIGNFMEDECIQLFHLVSNPLWLLVFGDW